MRKGVQLLSIVVAGFVLAGCGGTREADSRPAVQDRCRGGYTRPLDVKTVIEVARRHAITLYDDPQCIPDPTIVRQASNLLLYGPNTNVGRQEEIARREGDVTCMLRVGSKLPPTVKRIPPEVERIHYSGDDETYFSIFNLQCVIYPDPGHSTEQLERLAKTMSELRRRATRS